ncbi:hypothetical protein [Alkalihalobacillus trypoxylicola]|nr:hypothetical protein [Alkalihalobacillus trypoxylicola]
MKEPNEVGTVIFYILCSTLALFLICFVVFLLMIAYVGYTSN